MAARRLPGRSALEATTGTDKATFPSSIRHPIPGILVASLSGVLSAQVILV